MGDTPDWFDITRRTARSVQTTIGWIFWDPGAVARYAELGIPKDFAGPLGYMAARCAPIAAAGPDAVIAACRPFGGKQAPKLCQNSAKGELGGIRHRAALGKGLTPALRPCRPENAISRATSICRISSL